MSRIRLEVEVHNHANAPLVYQGDHLEWGDWTDPWQPRRTAVIPPGGKAEWRAEGDLALAPTTGTEGAVRYAVDGDRGRPFVIEFNSPLVESQYGNTFRILAPPGLEASHSGGQGHHARLIVHANVSALRSVRGFRPSLSGFAFSNSTWPSGLDVVTVGYLWNRLRGGVAGAVAEALGIGQVDDNWLPITEAKSGLCGGMVFAAMDYYNARRLPPTVRDAPASSSDSLFQFLRARLLDSFDITGAGHRWLGYSSPHYPDGDSTFLSVAGLARGRAWVTYRDEWPRIRADIDQHRPSPIGLIQTTNLAIGDNHQVLAYAYKQDGQRVDLHIYDPNDPGNDNLVLHFDITSTSGAVQVTRSGYPSAQPRVHCIFRADGYQPLRAPQERILSVRQALDRDSGQALGSLPGAVGLSRPASIHRWLHGA